MIYKDLQEKMYVGVCMQMNVVKVASDPARVEKELQEAVDAILTMVKKGKLSEKVLNNKAPEEYWQLFRYFWENSQNHKSSPISHVDSAEVKFKSSPVLQELCCA